MVLLNGVAQKSGDLGIGKFSFIPMFSKFNFELNFKHVIRDR